jgi:FG-GAP repeat protein
VVYRRSGVTESDVNGPAGLEQSFTIAAPAVSRPRDLTLALRLGGSLRPEADKNGAGASFVDDAGKVIARYDGLVVRDANGRQLSARLVVQGSRGIAIRVDARGAAFPITVDPYIDTGVPDVGSWVSDIALSGNTLVVTPFYEVDPDDTWPLAYVLTKPAAGWNAATVVATLSASTSYFYFQPANGTVAISGSTIAVGERSACFDSHCGAVFVYTEPEDGWSNAEQTAVLTASDATNDSSLGSSVAIDGSTIVAGDPSVAETEDSPTAGGAYVFSEPEDGWADATETARLYNTGSVTELGTDVAISGSTIAVVGEAGDSDVIDEYTKPGGGWSSQAPTAVLTNSDSDDLAGTVAASGDTIAAPGAGSDHKVYVYSKPEDGWADATETAQLEGSDSASDSAALAGIAIDGSTIVASAPDATVDGLTDSGEVYAWTEPEDGWSDMSSQTARLTDLPSGFPERLLRSGERDHRRGRWL